MDILRGVIGALKIDSQTATKEIDKTAKVLNLFITEYIKITEKERIPDWLDDSTAFI